MTEKKIYCRRMRKVYYLGSRNFSTHELHLYFDFQMIVLIMNGVCDLVVSLFCFVLVLTLLFVSFQNL